MKLFLLLVVLSTVVLVRSDYYTSTDHMIILVHMSEDVTSQLAYVVKREEPKNKDLLK